MKISPSVYYFEMSLGEIKQNKLISLFKLKYLLHINVFYDNNTLKVLGIRTVCIIPEHISIPDMFEK